MRILNACMWLTIQSLKPCSRNCVGEFCAIHNALLKRGGKMSQPCWKCKKGTQSEIQICKHCGSSNARQKLNNIEKKTKRKFEFVLQELKYKVARIY